jgi:hypothetical protein
MKLHKVRQLRRLLHMKAADTAVIETRIPPNMQAVLETALLGAK